MKRFGYSLLVVGALTIVGGVWKYQATPVVHTPMNAKSVAWAHAYTERDKDARNRTLMAFLVTGGVMAIAGSVTLNTQRFR